MDTIFNNHSLGTIMIYFALFFVGFLGGLVGKPTQWCRPTTFLCKKWAYCLSAFLSLPTTTAMPSVGRTIGGSVSIGQGVTAVAAILAGLSAGSFTGSHARRQFLREQAVIEERVWQDNDQM